MTTEENKMNDKERVETKASSGQAELIGQSAVNAAVFGGGSHTWRLQLKLKLVKREDAWMITEAKASTY